MTGSVGLSPRSAFAAPSDCTKAKFIGIRGSGEAFTASDYGMGSLVSAGYESFKGSVEGSGIPVEPEGLKYPAVPIERVITDAADYPHNVTAVYISVRAGSEVLKRLVEETDPSTCLVVAGYSQGAWVITHFFSEYSSLSPRFTALLLMGDPAFHYDSDAVKGSAENALGILRHSSMPLGLVPGESYFEGHGDRVLSYCFPADPICDFKGLTHSDTLSCLSATGIALTPWCPHLGYGASGYLGAGINFLVERMKDGHGIPIVPFSTELNERNIDLRRWCTSVGGGNEKHPPAVDAWRRRRLEVRRRTSD